MCFKTRKILRLALCLFVFATLSLLSGAVSAAEIREDGAASRQFRLQQERDQYLRDQQESNPDVRLQPEQAPIVNEKYPDKEQPCFLISRITLVGDEASRFAFALSAVTEGDDPAIGRCLGTVGINVALTRVQNLIIARGYVTTRVLVGPQDLKSGELVLTVVPGRVHTIRLTPDSSPRGNLWNALPISPGDILNLRDIEQGLENLKRAPTADADIQIEPASEPDAKPGESDLVVRYRQGIPFRVTLSLDDGGSDYTGKYIGGVTLSADNLLTLNDLFYANYNHDLGGGKSGDRGTRGYTFYYSVPFDYWQLSATTSGNNYHQAVAGASQTYQYSGTSKTSEVQLSRLVYRDAVRKTTLSGGIFFSRSDNYIDDTRIEVQRRREAGWQAGINHREYIGRVTLDGNLSYQRGTGMLDSLPAPGQDFGEGTTRVKITNADLTAVVPFQVTAPWGPQVLRYQANWRAQWNGTPLTPQDRFTIGTRYTVRGFDGQSTLFADRGWLIRNDLGFPVAQTGQELYWGLDYGEVGGQSAKYLIGTRLAGTVIGARGGFKGLQYDVFVGAPLKKPDGFETASTTAGFNLNWTF